MAQRSPGGALNRAFTEGSEFLLFSTNQTRNKEETRVLERKEAMNIENTTSVIVSLCYNAPNVDPTFTYVLLRIQWLQLAVGLILLGAAFALPGIMSILSIIVQTFLVWVLWEIMLVAASPRPPGILNDKCFFASSWFDSMNLYGVPDPINVPNLAYMAVFIYMFHRLKNDVAKYAFAVVFIASFAYYTVEEFVLGRIYIWQYFVNVVIMGVVVAIICPMLHYFYTLDMSTSLTLHIRAFGKRLFAKDKVVVNKWIAHVDEGISPTKRDKNGKKKGKQYRQRKRYERFGVGKKGGPAAISLTAAGSGFGKNGYDLPPPATANSDTRKGEINSWASSVDSQTFEEGRELRRRAIEDVSDLLDTLKALPEPITTSESVRTLSALTEAKKRFGSWISSGGNLLG